MWANPPPYQVQGVRYLEPGGTPASQMGGAPGGSANNDDEDRMKSALSKISEKAKYEGWAIGRNTLNVESSSIWGERSERPLLLGGKAQTMPGTAVSYVAAELKKNEKAATKKQKTGKGTAFTYETFSKKFWQDFKKLLLEVLRFVDTIACRATVDTIATTRFIRRSRR